MLYHRDCGGTISIDITKIISWKSPSVSIQEDGIKVGVTEFRGSTNVDTENATFCCEKCEEKDLLLKDLEKFADIDCPVCGSKTPITDLMVARHGFALCSSCLKIAKGEKTTKKERILKTLTYFNLQNSRMEFRPFSETIVKKICF